MKTNKELIIELRNSVAYRLIEARCNLAYWKRIIRKLKANTPEIIEAIEKKRINEVSIPKDVEFLKVIDEMIKKGGY